VLVLEDTKLYCMLEGSASWETSDMTIGDFGPKIRYAVPMFLIDHPEGLVLFETGYDPQVGSDPAAYLGPENAMAWKIEMKEEDAAIYQIERLGYRPKDIKYVIMSCLYSDHAGGMKYFPQSTHIVQRAELREAWWPSPYNETYYNYKDIKDTRNFKFIQLDGGDLDVFNDSSVIVKSYPCHAIGEQVVILRLKKNGTIVFPAGLITIRKNYELNKIPGVLMVSPAEAWKNVQSLRQIIAREKAKVMYHHDLQEWMTYKKLPDYYD